MAFSGRSFAALLLLACALLALFAGTAHGRSSLAFNSGHPFIVMPTSEAAAGDEAEKDLGRTKWALLIAGSAGYGNYRHQADVCHAYQLLKRDGLKDENIVVFMYDDIADSEENPYPGTIINHPRGSDVYAGVPKDYTGADVSVENFLAVLKGDASAVKGGSGKVIASGPKDHVFVFYSDHGGPGILGMPEPPFLMGDDINRVLKEKHTQGGFEELVFYLEACESGSIFQGLLPKDINVYAVTAANAEENSWGTYCPGMDPPPPPEYDTCLGDLFSVSWMEDSDVHNLHKESLSQQYRIVKARTAMSGTYFEGSHVMQYGNKSIDEEEAAAFLGSNPANEDAPPVSDSGLFVQGLLDRAKKLLSPLAFLSAEPPELDVPLAVHQRDADLLYLESKYKRATDLTKKQEALAAFQAQHALRQTMKLEIGRFSTALAQALPPLVTAAAREPDAPLVDDWVCLRETIRAYERACGPLTQYGMQFTTVFASLCNTVGDRPLAAALASSKAREACARDVPYEGPFSV